MQAYQNGPAHYLLRGGNEPTSKGYYRGADGTSWAMYMGVEKRVREWAEDVGVSKRTMFNRINKNGVAHAIETPCERGLSTGRYNCFNYPSWW